MFDLTATDCYYQIAGWSSPVARWAHNPKVVGSNPTPATKNNLNTLSCFLSYQFLFKIPTQPHAKKKHP